MESHPVLLTHLIFISLTFFGSGVGDAAVAIVERRNEAKGILRDGAILVVRRCKRQVAIMAPALARRDRPEALRIFGELGTAIAGRLK